MAAELKRNAVKPFCYDAAPSLLAHSDIVVEFIDNALSLFMPLGPFLIATIVS